MMTKNTLTKRSLQCKTEAGIVYTENRETNQVLHIEKGYATFGTCNTFNIVIISYWFLLVYLSVFYVFLFFIFVFFFTKLGAEG